MIRINEIKINICGEDNDLVHAAEKRLGLDAGSIISVKIAKESIDARKKPEIYRVYSLDLETEISDERMLDIAAKRGVRAGIACGDPFVFAPVQRRPEHPPVVAGFGPCGMFAALTLAMYGLCPVVIERGRQMDERIKDVESFWRGGPFNEQSNVQFGEGGAGTFSDGKLTTGTRNEAQSFILQSFVDAGADPAILYRQKPHIGSDIIRKAVVNIRKKIIQLGGSIRFCTKLTDIDIKDGRLAGIYVNDAEYIPADVLILALGHSARDTVAMLSKKSLMIERKPFSMGLRIEHPQVQIDISQYGAEHGSLGLPAAEYKLNCKASDGRGVYTFCMCPGGYVINASSEAGGVVTNGMSNSARDGVFANSALLVDVHTDDFEGDHPLAGIDFQRKYERLAFEAASCNQTNPSESVGSFMKNGLLCKCLPGFVSGDLKEALPVFGRRLAGFDNKDATLTGIESRSSAPYRIKRAANGNALAADGSVVEGLYPGGEGAGYAGGIMSSACDGIHLAQCAVSIRD